MPGANRVIRAYQTTVSATGQGTGNVVLKWDAGLVTSVFQRIVTLPETDRVMAKPDEWFFYLAKLENRTGSASGGEACMVGWFESVRMGLRTHLKRLSTMTTRPNPKAPDESEIRRTYFYLRLCDGLFLLDSYGGNVVTSVRLQDYLREKDGTGFKKAGIQLISFEPLVDPGFLDQLYKFDVIRLATVRLSVEQNEVYDESDAIGTLQSRSRVINANYMDVVIGRKNARKNGLLPNKLREFLEEILRRKPQVVSARIVGTRSDGGSPELKLDGIEEKHRVKAELDAYGEALPEHMIQCMIDIGNVHPRLE